MYGISWKSASLIQLVVIAVLLAWGWSNFKERLDALDLRLARVEEDARVMAPLSQVMRGYQPERAIPHAYEPRQATGPANVATPGADSGLAWCPATENGGAEWLELSYDPPVTATEIRIHASFNPGAVVRVLGGIDETSMAELWAGSGLADAAQTITVASPVAIRWLKLELDTTKVPGWNEIDAVALVDAQGAVHWAKAATASSTWGKSKSVP